MEEEAAKRAEVIDVKKNEISSLKKKLDGRKRMIEKRRDDLATKKIESIQIKKDPIPPAKLDPVPVSSAASFDFRSISVSCVDSDYLHLPVRCPY